MNTYFRVVATINGETETMFGSFIRSECVSEIDSEKSSWKSDGYKSVKIISEDTDEIPDAEVYGDHIVTEHQLFMIHAPSFNFEKSSKEIVNLAIAEGLVIKISGACDAYLINENYELDKFSESDYSKFSDLDDSDIDDI